jgi:hypothetical protein
MRLDVARTTHESEQSDGVSDGIYKFNRGYKWLILVAGSLFILLIVGSLILASIRHETLSLKLIALAVLELAGVIAAMFYVEGRSQRTLQIDDEGIFVRDSRGNEIRGIRWIELSRVGEGRAMGRLALWDRSGTRRVLVDQQFEPFTAIRSRILDEYAKVFTPRPLPMEFRPSHWLNAQSVLIGSGVAFFVWAAYKADQDHARGPAMLLAGFAILSLVALLNLYPQLRGPSLLFQDRIVLRNLFRTRELFKKEITGIALKDVSNSSGTRFSLINLQTTSGKQLKITFVYGDIPEMYLTLRAWLTRQD